MKPPFFLALTKTTIKKPHLNASPLSHLPAISTLILKLNLNPFKPTLKQTLKF